jgi:pterin-4a-carbinolamine dehydratase
MDYPYRAKRSSTFSRRQLLHHEALQRAVLSLRGWHQRGYDLVKAFPAGSHKEAMDIISEIGRILTEFEHEPAVEVRAPERTVHLAIHTPSQGGITSEDIRQQGVWTIQRATIVIDTESAMPRCVMIGSAESRSIEEEEERCPRFPVAFTAGDPPTSMPHGSLPGSTW